MEIYASWSYGLERCPEALHTLRSSGIIAGVETKSISRSNMLISDAGLKVSLHCPAFRSPIYDLQMDDELEEAIKSSDAETVSFHTGVPIKFIDKSVFPWTVKLDDVGAFEARERERLEQVSGLVDKTVAIEVLALYGLGPSFDFMQRLTSPEHVQYLLSSTENTGLLLDVSHNIITATTLQNAGVCSVDDHFDRMLAIGKTYHMHVNRPEGNYDDGFRDKHLTFEGDHPCLHYAKRVVDNAPELKMLTLEMKTDLPPEEHARVIVEQAELLLRYVGK